MRRHSDHHVPSLQPTNPWGEHVREKDIAGPIERRCHGRPGALPYEGKNAAQHQQHKSFMANWNVVRVDFPVVLMGPARIATGGTYVLCGHCRLDNYGYEARLTRAHQFTLCINATLLLSWVADDVGNIATRRCIPGASCCLLSNPGEDIAPHYNHCTPAVLLRKRFFSSGILHLPTEPCPKVSSVLVL